jgi:phosphatidate cytidylyltransferase
MNANLKLRLITATGLISVFLLALFLAPASLWILFVLAFMAGAAWEWAGLIGYGPGGRIAYAAATALIALFAGMNGLQGQLMAYLPALAFWLVLAPLWLARAWRLPGKAVGVLVGWLLLLPTCLAWCWSPSASPWWRTRRPTFPAAPLAAASWHPASAPARPGKVPSARLGRSPSMPC